MIINSDLLVGDIGLCGCPKLQRIKLNPSYLCAVHGACAHCLHVAQLAQNALMSDSFERNRKWS